MTKAPTHHRRLQRLAPFLALACTAALAGCVGGAGTNRQFYSVHQPVVSHTAYTLDVNTGPAGLAPGEADRLAGWFKAMNLQYGDHIAIDDPAARPATRAEVEKVAARFNLLVTAEAPTTAGYVNTGVARIILTRASAGVPGCPDWSSNSETNFRNANSSNYGCAVNSNLAAMVANPDDLLSGEKNTGNTQGATAIKAIDAYRTAKPTGANNQIKQTSSQSTGS